MKLQYGCGTQGIAGPKGAVGARAWEGHLFYFFVSARTNKRHHHHVSTYPHQPPTSPVLQSYGERTMVEPKRPLPVGYTHNGTGRGTGLLALGVWIQWEQSNFKLLTHWQSSCTLRTGIAFVIAPFLAGTLNSGHVPDCCTWHLNRAALWQPEWVFWCLVQW